MTTASTTKVLDFQIGQAVWSDVAEREGLLTAQERRQRGLSDKPERACAMV
jgi:hypothetical protein